MRAGRPGCAWGQEVRDQQCRVLPPPQLPPGPRSHPLLLLAGGAGTLGVYGAEVLLKMLLLQLQVPGGHQGRAKALGEERGKGRQVNHVFTLCPPHPLWHPPRFLPLLPRASPLSAWGKRSRTCRIQEPRRPPDQWHSWGWGHGGRRAQYLKPWSHTQVLLPTLRLPLD